MDKLEHFDDQEEVIRSTFSSLMRSYHFASPCIISEDTRDGHRCVPLPSIQRAVTNPINGLLDFIDHPIAPDVPIHFAGGKKVVATHPVGRGDEGLVVYADRALDVPMQQGGTARPIDDRQHDAGDGTYIPGIRSDPKKLAQVDNDAHHVRSVDKLHVHETHPDHGHRSFSADPSTPPASENFDPLSQATKFIDHSVRGAGGLIGRAVSGSAVHSHGVDHDAGAFMRVLGTLHQVLCHPSLGALLSAADGKHTVTASPSGVMLQSATGISLQCPPGTLSLPKGGVSGGSIQGGGDISGTLDQAKVTNLSNVVGQDQELVRAKSDAAAASAGVLVGELYVNVAVAQGVGLLAVRLV